MKIKYVNTNATKSTLPVGTLGYDAYVAGGDEGRVGVGTASGNVLLAKKSEVDAVYTKTELDAGQLDNRYYTETESNTLFEPADATILKDADIGITVQAYDAGLQSIVALTTAADKMIYTTASDTYAVTTLTAAGRALIDDVDATAQRSTLGLGNVDNTSDANKPVSTATQTALNSKAPLASPALTGTPTAPTATIGTNTTQLATTAFVLANNSASEIASTAEAQAGTDDTKAITPLKLREGLNASGTAPIYACRAWVNFNGTGTVAIRASGNVSSITDLGVGNYRVNFTTPMPGSGYSAIVSGTEVDNQNVKYATPISSSQLSVKSQNQNGTVKAFSDCSVMMVSIFI